MRSQSARKTKPIVLPRINRSSSPPHQHKQRAQTTNNIIQTDDSSYLFPSTTSSTTSSILSKKSRDPLSVELSARLSAIIDHHVRATNSAPTANNNYITLEDRDFFGSTFNTAAVQQLQSRVRATSPFRTSRDDTPESIVGRSFTHSINNRTLMGSRSSLNSRGGSRNVTSRGSNGESRGESRGERRGESRGSHGSHGSPLNSRGTNNGGFETLIHSRILDSRGSFGSSSNMFSLAESGDEFYNGTPSSSRPETPHAAIRIQEAWKNYGWRMNRADACLRLQTWYRGWRDRERARLRDNRAKQSKFLLAMMRGDNPMKRRVKLACSFDTLVTNAIEGRAAVGFQSLFRGRQARTRSTRLAKHAQKVKYELEYKSSTIIQTCIRKYLSIKFVQKFRLSIYHMTSSSAVSNAIDALVLTGGHPKCHWRRCRALSMLETLIMRWSENMRRTELLRLRNGLGRWVVGEMRKRKCTDASFHKIQLYFNAEEIPLVLYGRRDWPSGAPLSLMCVKRGDFFILTGHWQYLEGATLAGVTVISNAEAYELYYERYKDTNLKLKSFPEPHVKVVLLDTTMSKVESTITWMRKQWNRHVLIIMIM